MGGRITCIGIDDWRYIFNTVEGDSSLDEHNVIDKIKEKLKEKSGDVYKEWKRYNFDINYSFNVDGYITLGTKLLTGAVTNRSLKILRALSDRGATFANPPSLACPEREDYEQIVKFLAVYEFEPKLSEIVELSFFSVDYFCITKQSEYWNRCLDEVKRMKEEKIHNNVTFYNVLTGDSNELAYSAWKGVLLKTSEGDYKSKFPIYSNDLKHQLKIGNQRLDALQIAEIIIGKIFAKRVGKEGPFSRKIAGYLSNEDIENLRKATIQVQEPNNPSSTIKNECGETSRCLAKDENIIQPLKEAETITSKAIKTGVTLGIITALTIGIGCSIAGVELSILAIAGIAVAAALVIGVIAGGITYSVSKPSDKLDKPDLKVFNQQVPEKV
ncbi:hypothetical protein wVul_1486 [Wolbachia endosymbiont of Armadillidium vulgare str. wVulC]|uniref:hypothetical protein n=1 Tax=Wolbachia endosymbiont of Armadillidium vulgare TaxID=77039 RepID=UPI0006D4C49B|nr:hypothetical protein [Wolbachia endosymbiont of Armadillidium vulgare]KLT21741.1 hypothetical protein wVul_1486 [Wolbachia endosymbiont of Armadillidium vulgare str. wVulC]